MNTTHITPSEARRLTAAGVFWSLPEGTRAPTAAALRKQADALAERIAAARAEIAQGTSIYYELHGLIDTLTQQRDAVLRASALKDKGARQRAAFMAGVL
jgi:hypothetical protein